MIRAKTILSGLLLVVLIAIAALVWLGDDYRAFIDEPISSELDASDDVRLWVANGDTPARVVRQLERLGLARPDWRWRLLARLDQPVIRVGEYRLDRSLTPAGLFDMLEQGDVVEHRFTIIEGWTIAQLRHELAMDPRLDKRTSEFDDETLMIELDCAGCFAEGWFLPETYQFVRGDSDFDLLSRAHSAMREVLERTWAQRATGLPLEQPEQLLIMASLVEQETTLMEEAPRVAGVFVRRLQRGMRLQTDPTVAYGVDLPPGGRLRRVHLNTDHPWNTYTRHGLPPTPIALPGPAAMAAAANPLIGDALYFVARGDGSHYFSATLAEHNRAVARYILGR